MASPDLREDGAPGVRRRALDKAVSALLLAALVALTSVLLGSTSVVRRVSEIGVDQMMQLNVAEAPSTPSALRYVIFDADDAACDALIAQSAQACDRDSPVLRRAFIAALAVANLQGARAVVLDVDLSVRTDAATDAALRDQLAQMRMPVFVPRPVRPYLDKDSGRYRYRSVPTLADGLPNVAFAHTVWQADPDSDVIRRPISSIDAPQVGDYQRRPDIPAMGVAVAARVLGKPEALLICKTRYCDGGRHDEEKRIVFSLTDRVPRFRMMFGFSNLNTHLPRVQSLSPLLSPQSEAPLDPKLALDAVVLIGSGRSDGGDIHETPIGPLSGPMVIVNHINALELYDGLTKPFWLTAFLVKLGIACAFTVLVFVYWCSVFSIRDRVRPGVVRGALQGAAGGVLLLSGFLLIMSWSMTTTWPAMQKGFLVEPWTPILALLFEVSVEAIARLLTFIDHVGQCLTQRLSSAFNIFTQNSKKAGEGSP